MGMFAVKSRKQEYYLGELVRFYCPSLYGEPVYGKDREFISYIITRPKIGYVKGEEIVGGLANSSGQV